MRGILLEQQHKTRIWMYIEPCVHGIFSRAGWSRSAVSMLCIEGKTNQYFFCLNQMAGKHPSDLVSRKKFWNYSLHLFRGRVYRHLRISGFHSLKVSLIIIKFIIIIIVLTCVIIWPCSWCAKMCHSYPLIQYLLGLHWHNWGWM